MVKGEKAAPRAAPSPTIPPMFSERPKVIYVMGAGRSGSTILGVTLGNCEDWFFAGELDKWLLMSGISMHERDAPEDLHRDRELWQTVREDVDAPPDIFGREARRCIEHSTSLLRLDKLPVRRRLLLRYRLVTEKLYRSVAERTGADHIVDSSHLPLRALQLQSMKGIELYLLFLVREPRGVVASWDRRGLPEPRFSMLATNAYLWLTNLLSTFVFLRHSRERRLFVRYEDFLAKPEAVLGDILACAGSDAAIPDLSSLSTGSPYHGNRLIFSERVSVRRGPTTPSPAAPLTRALQLPWAFILARLRPLAGTGL